MTYKEWITTVTSRFHLTASDVELILVNQKAIIPNPDSEVDVRIAKMALIAEFGSIIPLANISEGGYSVNWNMDAIKLWYKSLCHELGVKPITTAKIQNRSNLW